MYHNETKPQSCIVQFCDRSKELLDKGILRIKSKNRKLLHAPKILTMHRSKMCNKPIAEIHI